MPNVILILLIVAGVGIAGSLALMILTAVLSIRQNRMEDASEEDDNVLYAEEEEAEEDLVEEEGEETDTLIFKPLEAEAEEKTLQEEIADAFRKEDFDAETTQPEAEAAVAHYLHEEDPALQLVDIVEPSKPNSALVGSLNVAIGNAQDMGARLEQQDAFAITPLEEQAVVDSRGVMAVVCDGMGGMECGAEAANLGAVTFMRSYLTAEVVDDNALVDAVYAANEAVYENHQGKDGVIAGTTLVAASVQKDGLRFVSVGDSHVYLYRNGKLYQLNRDHNYFSELLDQVRAGTITLEEAQRHPERAHLTSYVGIRNLQLVDYNIEPVDLRAGDRVLLCSDGLFKTLSIHEITAGIANAEQYDVQNALMNAVKAKGKRKQDNITIVVLYCD